MTDCAIVNATVVWCPFCKSQCHTLTFRETQARAERLRQTCPPFPTLVPLTMPLSLTFPPREQQTLAPLTGNSRLRPTIPTARKSMRTSTMTLSRRSSSYSSSPSSRNFPSITKRAKDVLKSSLDALTTLAGERCMALWEYDAPESSHDELSSLEFAEAKELSVSLYLFAARLMASYSKKSARVPRALIRNLRRIVNARGELLRSEREH